MKEKVWTITWPLVLIVLGFLFIPELMIFYILIGMAIKVGKIASSDHNNFTDFKSAFGYIVEAYQILVWPRHFSGNAYKGTIKVVSGSILGIALVSGVLYYLGSSSIVPNALTERYLAILAKSDHPLPSQVRDEIGKRIEEGFSYSDLQWSRSQIQKSCGYDKQPESQMDRFKATIIIGLYSLDSSYSSGTLAAQDAKYTLNCVPKKSEKSNQKTSN